MSGGASLARRVRATTFGTDAGGRRRPPGARAAIALQRRAVERARFELELAEALDDAALLDDRDAVVDQLGELAAVARRAGDQRRRRVRSRATGSSGAERANARDEVARRRGHRAAPVRRSASSSRLGAVVAGRRAASGVQPRLVALAGAVAQRHAVAGEAQVGACRSRWRAGRAPAAPPCPRRRRRSGCSAGVTNGSSTESFSSSSRIAGELVLRPAGCCISWLW